MKIKKTINDLPPGWVEGTVKDFLGMNRAEYEMMQLTVRLAKVVKAHLAKPPRPIKTIAAELGLPLTQVRKYSKFGHAPNLQELLQIYFALGGRASDVVDTPTSQSRSQ
jgi:hypothetical protein